jgi:hypothetical protein
MTYWTKLKSRTEWQAYLLAVAVLFANHFFDMGLTTEELLMYVGLTTGYGVSRGLAKSEEKSEE